MSTRTLIKDAKEGQTEQEDVLYSLFDLSSFLDQHTNLDDCLHEIAVMSSDILGTENCSIMLLKDDRKSDEIALRVFAHSGYLPTSAHREAKKLKEGVAGYVAATGQALYVEDIEHSQFAPLKRGRYKSKGFIAAPIKIHDKVIGVINANTPKCKPNIDRRDLEILTVIALLIGKSIQVIQLQSILRSKYAQFALAHNKPSDKVDFSLSLRESPGTIAKILARTFYSEMTEAGFGADHIITTASEIVSLLTEKLKKHSQRIRRSQEQ